MWKELTEQFKNPEFNSGGVVQAGDEALVHAKIDIERHNTTGEIGYKKVFNLFRATFKLYAKAAGKFFQATGVHSQMSHTCLN
jgi:hypothetical protein